MPTKADLTKRVAELEKQLANPPSVRRHLPDTRRAVNHKFTVGGIEGYILVGLYGNSNTVGEIFIHVQKEGSTLGGLLDSFAITFSLALQYNVPLEVLCNKLMHQRYEPSGITCNTAIPEASSITDYLMKWLMTNFNPTQHHA